MADSTTPLAQIEMAQAQKEVTANGLFDAASPATFGGRRAESCTGLTWGYYGGRLGGVGVANGTVTLSASLTNYLVANRATGLISLASGSPNEWDDTAGYARLYEIVAGSSTVSSYQDHRLGDGGVFMTGLGPNLADFAALTAATDDFIQFKSGAWSVRTVAQVTADLHGTGSTADTAGFRGLPQNSRSTAYTTVLADSGKHLLHPSADTTARTFTIDSNANVPYAIGTAITFVNQASAGVLTIAINSDTMRLAGAGTTGSRTLAANGIATALKLTTTEWIISGTGLT
jgi:hypothetical protein